MERSRNSLHLIELPLININFRYPHDPEKLTDARITGEHLYSYISPGSLGARRHGVGKHDQTLL